jgi:ABC-type amino acid transport substrate-binding protein
MIRKGNDTLREEINSALDEMTRDGTRGGLILTWFGNSSVGVLNDSSNLV